MVADDLPVIHGCVVGQLEVGEILFGSNVVKLIDETHEFYCGDEYAGNNFRLEVLVSKMISVFVNLHGIPCECWHEDGGVLFEDGVEFGGSSCDDHCTQC